MRPLLHTTGNLQSPFLWMSYYLPNMGIYIYHLTQRITELRLNPCFELSGQFNFPNHASQYADLLILLYTVTRHTIWKIRNTARFENKTVDSDKIIHRIKQTLRHRYSCKTSKTKPIYENTLRRLCTALWWKKLLPKCESPTRSETPCNTFVRNPHFLHRTSIPPIFRHTLVDDVIGINSHKYSDYCQFNYPHQNPTKQMQTTRPLVSASPLHFDSKKLAANVVKQITRASAYWVFY